MAENPRRSKPSRADFSLKKGIADWVTFPEFYSWHSPIGSPPMRRVGAPLGSSSTSSSAALKKPANSAPTSGSASAKLNSKPCSSAPTPLASNLPIVHKASEPPQFQTLVAIDDKADQVAVGFLAGASFSRQVRPSLTYITGAFPELKDS